jgi:DNA (cytosine-5)-methyltransferase 1
MNGLDLFSGIGGISLALRPWVHTSAFCEQDRYAQSVLLSRMEDGSLERAPIWDDVRTLRGSHFHTSIDIIFGGFPCQDISVAGRGEGLEGKRSGLFFEIIRLTSELKPTFVFLENVPAIRTRGLREVVRAFTDLRYDCRWTRVSAAEVGANHIRERWFLLAYSDSTKLRHEQRWGSRTSWQGENEPRDNGSETMADSECDRLEKSRNSGIQRWQTGPATDASWWATEPSVGRVVNGLPNRVDRIKCLGNSVLPLQARTAFKRLAGLE